MRGPRLKQFLDATDAEAICGYRGAADWSDGAAIDLLLLSALAHRQTLARPASITKTLAGFWARYASLLERGKFDYITAEGRASKLLGPARDPAPKNS